NLAGEVLQREAQRLQSRSDAYLFHEFLDAENSPCYFREFIDRAQASGLQYLADQHLTFGWENRLGPGEAASWTEFAGDRLAIEQHLDVISGQTFRQTLLCHAERTVERVPRSDVLQRSCISASLT